MKNNNRVFSDIMIDITTTYRCGDGDKRVSREAVIIFLGINLRQISKRESYALFQQYRYAKSNHYGSETNCTRDVKRVARMR